jgi:hypothetical protein
MKLPMVRPVPNVHVVVFPPLLSRDTAMDPMQESGIWQTLMLLLQTLGTLALQLTALGFHWLLWINWAAWWLGAVNAKKTRYVLARGGWAPALLLIVLAALVWSRLEPRPCDCLGFMTVPNFWWQLGYVSMLAATALFCGWLQSVLHWTPPEIHIDPPAHSHGHAHGQGHGHEPGHGHATAHH